jgi:DNA adenine methylase
MTLALSKYAGSHLWLVEQRPEVFPRPAAGRAARIPFAGAGSPVFGIYASHRPLVVSDKNERLINAWAQVRDDVEGVVGHLRGIVDAWRLHTAGCGVVERDERGRVWFESVRELLDEGAPTRRAARMLFVLRASFNGLWRVNLNGQCNSPYGKPGPDADLVRVEDLRRMAALLQGVDIRCEDFGLTMADAGHGEATYLDCPFQGTHTAYCADHAEWEARQATLPGMGEANARERLAALLHELDARGVRWTLSDADTPVTRQLYAGWGFEVIRRQNSITCKGGERGDAATEGLWRNWS